MSEHVSYLQPGQRLSRFEIRRLVGRGGAAEVYRALDPQTQQEVALKVLHPQAADAAEKEAVRRRFMGIVEAVAALRHPNIITLYDFGIIDRFYYIAMQLTGGRSLRDRLSERRSGCAYDYVIKVFRQIADAVAYAHEQGVIHHDIRPGNILLVRDDQPLLTDFGVSRILGGDPSATLVTSTGAPTYMSPEQVAGREVDHRTDIYSLGVLLYEMVTGDVPFKGSTPTSIFVQHMQNVPHPPSQLRSDLDPRMEGVILQALAKDPRDRFASARDMLVVLEKPPNEGSYDTLALAKEGRREISRQVRAAQTRRAAREGRETVERPAGAGSGRRTMALIVLGLLLVVIVVLVLLALSAQGATP